MMIDYGDKHALVRPLIYVSTAITSAGFSRDPNLQGPDNLRTVIERNGQVCIDLVAALASSPSPIVLPANAMVPTELGNVPGWTDTNYIEFYFGWCLGLDKATATEYSRMLAAPVYASIRLQADARGIPNEQRWPAYQAFAEAATSLVAELDAKGRTAEHDACRYLLQLVDVSESLGCRAETLMAQSLGLDILTVVVTEGSDGSVFSQVTALRSLGATVGADSAPVQIVALSVNR